MACNAQYQACYSECNDIPFWKFGQRSDCRQNCDSSYAVCEMAESALSSADSQREDEMKARILKWGIPIVVVLVVLVFVGKRKGWF
jgi:hypothetical protein